MDLIISTFKQQIHVARFVGSGSTLTLDFGITNLLLGSNGVIGTATNSAGFGNGALAALTNGTGNSAFGQGAGAAINTGNENTCLGKSAGAAINGGGQNLCVGKNAGSSLTSGSSNVILGQAAGSAYTAGESSNIIIGSATAGVAAESHKIRIGTSGSGSNQQNACFVAGINGVAVTGNLVSVSSTDQLGSVTTTSIGGNYIAGSGTLLYIPANYMPGCSNIGITYSAGTFTVNGFDGTALGATNPGYVTTQSPTSGLLVTTAVTANQTFTDGSGNLDTWRAGQQPTDLQGGVSSNWAQDVPFFLYGVLGTGNDIAFMISRDPRATISPLAANISKTGTILNVDQTDFFSLAGGTIANYASRPAVCLGSFRMRSVVNTGTIRYTVQSLNGSDGIGNFNDTTNFTFPTGVNSAVAGRYFANAGVSPQFSTYAVSYTLHRDGWVDYKADMQTLSNSGSLSGSNALQLACPYATAASFGQIPFQVVGAINQAAGSTVIWVNMGTGSNITYTNATNGFRFGAGATNLTNVSLGTGDSMQVELRYRAF